MRQVMTGFIQGRIWIILLAAVVILAAVIVLQPFSSARDTTADDVAAAWNESVGRLGITPVYPPAEDFYVGDLLAVLYKVNTAPNDVTRKTALPGKATRIAYIDLRNDIQSANAGQPVFPDTGDFKTGQVFYRDNLQEVESAAPNGRIGLSLVAFPGVAVTHKTKASASFNWALSTLGFGRDNEQAEQIRIPTALTYGAPISSAFVKLDKWCADPNTRIRCSDAYVRRALAYSVDSSVLATANGRYDTFIDLHFVYRVFMTREIEESQTIAGERTANLKITGGNAATAPADGDPGIKTPAPGLPQALQISESRTGAKWACIKCSNDRSCLAIAP
jgi:hypothetical protein